VLADNRSLTAPLKPAVTPEPIAAPPPAPEPVSKKDSLDLNWINMQTHVNDSLKRDLEVLSDKYEKLAQKEEKRKKLKAKMAQAARAPQPPPHQPPPQNPAPTQAPVQPRPGLYRRQGKLSINQFS
jgi:hypothetical protein